MEGARGVLLSIAGGSDLGLFEINEAASLVQEAAHIDANIIFGTVIDDSLGDEVRVTVIAAGFDGGTPARRPVEAPAQPAARTGTISPARAGELGRSERPEETGREAAPTGAGAVAAPGGAQPRPVPVDDEDGDDDVDVPIFMRR